jgi:adenylate cyclase
MSRLAGIPHASVCGGRGRCSTCRVRICSAAPQPPLDDAEARVLGRLGVPPDARLACQLRPTSDLLVVPLLPATATAAEGRPPGDMHRGREQEIAVLFRRPARLHTARRAPAALRRVFFLNRYFEGACRRVDVGPAAPRVDAPESARATGGVRGGPGGRGGAGIKRSCIRNRALTGFMELYRSYPAMRSRMPLCA